MMKYVIWLILSFWIQFSVIGIADIAIAQGQLDSIINIVVIDDNQLKQQVADLRLQSTPANGSTVARIYCDNNNFNGFSLLFHSETFGKLVFFKNNQYPSTVLDGHFIDYTLDLIRGDTGELGLDMPPENERKGFGLDMQHQILFNDNISQSTHAAEFKLNMHTLKKDSLFHGVFKDTITVTIQDL